MLRKLYIPKISKFKTFWRHLKPCHTMPKSNNDASCNFSSMNPLQSRILFLLSEERNKCNVCFPSTIFLCCLVCWCFQRLKERFVQIYRDFISIENTSYRDFANIDDMFWDLKKKIVKEGLVWDSHRTEQEDFSLKLWRVIWSSCQKV